jgi:hypothetical protein
MSGETTIAAGDLKVGDRFHYQGTVVTVLQAQEPTSDRFAQELIKYYAQRDDTKAKGYMVFGPFGAVTLASRNHD